MHRKDYKVIAEVIREIKMPEEYKTKLVNKLCLKFLEDNSHFNPHLFQEQCKEE